MKFDIDVRITLEGVDKILPEDLFHFSRYAVRGAAVFNSTNTTVYLLRMGEEEEPSRPSDEDLRMMKMLIAQGNCPQPPEENADSSQESPDESAEKPFQEGMYEVTKGAHGDGERDWEGLKQRHMDGGLRI